MKTIKLVHRGTYRDGGSKSLQGDNNKMYWQSFKIGDKNHGKLYEGDINDKNPKLAKGTFLIMEMKKQLIPIQTILQ